MGLKGTGSGLCGCDNFDNLGAGRIQRPPSPPPSIPQMLNELIGKLGGLVACGNDSPGIDCALVQGVNIYNEIHVPNLREISASFIINI